MKAPKIVNDILYFAYNTKSITNKQLSILVKYKAATEIKKRIKTGEISLYTKG